MPARSDQRSDPRGAVCHPALHTGIHIAAFYHVVVPGKNGDLIEDRRCRSIARTGGALAVWYLPKDGAIGETQGVDASETSTYDHPVPPHGATAECSTKVPPESGSANRQATDTSLHRKATTWPAPERSLPMRAQEAACAIDDQIPCDRGPER